MVYLLVNMENVDQWYSVILVASTERAFGTTQCKAHNPSEKVVRAAKEGHWITV